MGIHNVFSCLHVFGGTIIESVFFCLYTGPHRKFLLPDSLFSDKGSMLASEQQDSLQTVIPKGFSRSWQLTAGFSEHCIDIFCCTCPQHCSTTRSALFFAVLKDFPGNLSCTYYTSLSIPTPPPLFIALKILPRIASCFSFKPVDCSICIQRLNNERCANTEH